MNIYIYIYMHIYIHVYIYTYISVTCLPFIHVRIVVCCSLLQCVYMGHVTNSIAHCLGVPEPNATVLNCNTLPHNATDCNRLQQTVTDCNRLNTLQYSAIHCNTLQPIATHFNLKQHTPKYSATHCNTAQYSATRCNAPESKRWRLRSKMTVASAEKGLRKKYWRKISSLGDSRRKTPRNSNTCHLGWRQRRSASTART